VAYLRLSEENLIKYDMAIQDIKTIIIAIIEKLSSTDTREYKALLNTAEKDALLWSKLRVMLYCCEFFYHADHSSHTQNKLKALYQSFANDFKDKHLTAPDVWTPDCSWLSRKLPLQTTLGKYNTESDFILPKRLLLPMQPQFWRVDLGKSIDYFSRDEKKQNKIRNPDDLKSLQEKINDNTTNNATKCIYVITPKGGLIVYPHDDSFSHHSQARSGQYVACAGHLHLDNSGKITRMDNDSGHYKPSSVHLLYAALHLYKKRLIGDDCIIAPLAAGQKTKTIGYISTHLTEFLHGDALSIAQAILERNHPTASSSTASSSTVSSSTVSSSTVSSSTVSSSTVSSSTVSSSTVSSSSKRKKSN